MIPEHPNPLSMELEITRNAFLCFKNNQTLRIILTFNYSHILFYFKSFEYFQWPLEIMASPPSGTRPPSTITLIKLINTQNATNTT